MAGKDSLCSPKSVSDHALDMFIDTEFSTVSDNFCWIGWIDSCMALTVASSLASSLASRRFSMAFSDSVSVSCMFSFGVVRFDCLCACANRVGICGLQVLQAQNISSLATTGSSLFLMSAQFMQCQSRQKLHSIGVPLLLSDSHSFLHDAQWLSSFLRQQTHLFCCHFLAHHFDYGRICRRHIGWRPWQPMHHQFPHSCGALCCQLSQIAWT